MKTTISTNREFKRFISKNRKNVTSINGIVFKENYPLIDASNTSTSYYDVTKQSDVALIPPFVIVSK